MQVSVEEVGNLTKKLIVTLPADMVGERLENAYDELRSDVPLKGFRKGKVPRRFLEKTYGEKVQQDVAEKLIQDTYFNALEETKIDAVVHPQIEKHDYRDDGCFSYEATVDVRPEFELGKYKDVTIEVDEIVIDDDAVDAALEEMRISMAPQRSVGDRPAGNGDLVTIDFQGYENGEAMKNVSGTNYSVEIGSGNNGKEFEDCLLGLTKDEKAEKEINFPEGFPNPVLEGKTITFEITVHDIKERVLPEINDEFAKDVDEKLETVDALREHIRADLITKREGMQKGEISDKLMNALLDAHDFEVPNRLVVYEAEMMVKEMEQNLMRQGVNLESTGMSKDKLAENYLEPATKRVKGDFIIKKIADEEKITLDDKDIEQGFDRLSRQYNMPVAEIKQYFQAREDLLPFMNELLNEKVLAMLRENVVINRVTPVNEPEAPATVADSEAAAE